MSSQKDSKILHSVELIVFMLESLGFKGRGWPYRLSKRLLESGYKYAPQHINSVLNTRKKPLSDKFVMALVNSLNITESDLITKGSDRYKDLNEPDSDRPVVSTPEMQFKGLREDQIKLLAEWEKLDCKKRGALMVIMESLKGQGE